MATVTLSWEGYSRGSVANQGDTGVRVYTVVGATDPDSVVSLMAAAGVSVNVPWSGSDANNVLLCQSVVPRFKSPTFAEAVASFAVSPTGYFQSTVPPTQLPWKYRFAKVLDDQPFDRDPYNNPILNAAGDPPSSPPRTTVVKVSCQILRCETTWDDPTFGYYDDTVSSDDIDFTVPGATGPVHYPAGSIRCVKTQPAAEYTVNDKYVWLTVDLELLNLQRINPNLTDPFQLHLLNVGSTGWYTAADGSIKRGHLLYASGDPVDADVPLDGTGVPIDPSILVSGDGGDPASPVPNPNGLPGGCVVESIGSNQLNVTAVVWDRYRRVPLLPLLTPGGLS